MCARVALSRRSWTVFFGGIVVAAASLLPAVLAGDHRLHAWGQGGTLLAVALLPLLFRSVYSHRGHMAAGLVLYGLAKLAEPGDGAVFAWTGSTVSGHTLKHLLAAAAVAALGVMLVRRHLRREHVSGDLLSERPGS